MSETPVVGKRDQVKALIAEGKYTKKEIADILETKPGNVSSQMTYLRWQGNFIVADPETKVLTFVSEEDFEAYEAAVAVARVSKKATTSKTPQERANALASTITKQTEALAKAKERVAQIEKDLALEPTDEELIDMLELANAERVILVHKIKKNNDLAESLPAPDVAPGPVATVASNEGDDDGDDDDDDDDDGDDDDEAGDEAGDDLL